MADLEDAVREAVIERANEVPVTESDRLVLHVSNPFDTGPLDASPASVSAAPEPTPDHHDWLRLVNIFTSSLPTPINLSGSAVKTPRCLPVQDRLFPRYSMTNSVRFSTRSLLTTLRGRPNCYGC